MKNGHQDPKITSIKSARQQRQRREKAIGRGYRNGGKGVGVREWIVGGVITAMAIGLIVSWVEPMLRSVASMGW